MPPCIVTIPHSRLAHCLFAGQTNHTPVPYMYIIHYISAVAVVLSIELHVHVHAYIIYFSYTLLTVYVYLIFLLFSLGYISTYNSPVLALQFLSKLATPPRSNAQLPVFYKHGEVWLWIFIRNLQLKKKWKSSARLSLAAGVCLHCIINKQKFRKT